ncbi:MAG: preprotein translocase subunit YajC [Clostridia bacterium]|nr:preprotein translocase subunit YajC [Clostridia bacterium]MDD6039586.1 preprotein translocase subunit YajC [Clostridia bacterium]
MEKLLLTLTEATAGAADAAEAVAGEMNPVGALIGTLFPLILMFALFYFMLIRPQRKKDKKVKEMLAALKHGDRVCTIGGIYGTITSIKDETIELSVSNENTKLIVARWAIRNVEEVTIENDSELLN